VKLADFDGGIAMRTTANCCLTPDQVCCQCGCRAKFNFLVTLKLEGSKSLQEFTAIGSSRLGLGSVAFEPGHFVFGYHTAAVVRFIFCSFW